jgi:drug/metabolite transporter (DMT)-like permease
MTIMGSSPTVSTATASGLVLASEGILSLYPILIKIVPTTLVTQWFTRFLTFPLLALLLSPAKDIPTTWSTTTLLAGLLNLVHIGTSYLSFSLLPAGIALSLFYLYPLLNVLAGSLFFGESLALSTLALLLLASLGVYLLSRPSASAPVSEPTGEPPTKTSYLLGVACALLAALTETLLYVFVRWDKHAAASPFYTILQLYPMGLLVLLLYLAFQPSALDTSPQHLLYLFGFNALVGFTGYATRFYSIPKVPTVVFSLLSFVGVFFGYLWGHWLTKEQTQPIAWLGSALIVFSAFIVRYTRSKDS